MLTPHTTVLHMLRDIVTYALKNFSIENIDYEGHCLLSVYRILFAYLPEPSDRVVCSPTNFYEPQTIHVTY